MNKLDINEISFNDQKYFSLKDTLSKKKSLIEIIKDAKREKSVGFSAIIFVAVFLELYWVLKDFLLAKINNITWLNGLMSSVIIFILGLGSATVLYYIIFDIIRTIHLKRWIKKNSQMWVNGYWLHIHLKNNIRIGFLNIDQVYDNLNVIGYNICPDNDNITTWKYEIGKVSQTKNDDFEFFGSYCAVRSNIKDGNINYKYGIHHLDILESSREDKFPVIMQGYFGDTAKVVLNDKYETDIQQHCGNLYFIRVGKELKQFLSKNQISNKDKLLFIQKQFVLCKKSNCSFKEIEEIYKISVENFNNN